MTILPGFARQQVADELMRAAPIEVTVTNPGGGDSGGLTNVELRASPVPISGTVSVGTVPVTGSFYPVTQPVSIASPVAVTGSFYQATQPISGTVSVSGSVAVTGAFYPATQPVSIASMPTTAVTGAFYQATQPVSIASLPALVAGTAAIGRVQPQYPAKVVRNFILDAFSAAPVAEAMQSVVQWYNNAAVATTVSPAVVPAGKILRLTKWWIETKSLATVGSVIVRIRANVSGTAVLASPLVESMSAGSIAGATTVAMTGAFSGMSGDFGEGGLEFAAGTGIGFSMAGYGPTGTLTLEGVTRFGVCGYEYTA